MGVDVNAFFLQMNWVDNDLCKHSWVGGEPETKCPQLELLVTQTESQKESVSQ